ncbi:hypothetical protein STHU_19960 [Allostella humosa]|uniref:2Fe-2S iron-sulfur cluster-binding protein n=1 Tax=Stella humosa TaxID=94 RepID=UPI000F4BD1E8|nr:2Fe-2S iron-sulfur cluster-binding protein [Stella humosa]BBK31362.1 hypothetical protein STHU_19960 [Stella humosa]
MTATVRVRRSGQWVSFACADTESLVDAAAAERIYLPASCRSGTCGTCLVRLVEGGVHISAEAWALSAADRDDGFILACQSRPATPELAIDYDD